MRAGLKIINSFCSLPTCSETKCKMNGKKSKLFSVSFYIRHLCCSKCPEYISQQMFLIQFIQTRFLLAVVIHCWFPGYVWEMTGPHFPASMVGRSVPSSREYKSIMKSLRIETKNPKNTHAERCRMAVAFLLLGQVAWI